MGSHLAKNAKVSEVIRALRCGALQPQSALDWAIAHAIIHVPGMSTDAQEEAWHSRYFCDPTCKLYVPFDETSGSTAHDVSGNGNTGTATGTTIVDGVFGKCRRFDGIDDVVSCGNVPLSTSAITIEAWIKWDSDNTASYPRVTDKAYAPSMQLARSIQAIRWLGDIGGERVDVPLEDAVVPQDEWCHVAMTYANDAEHAIKGYVNGVFKDSITDYSGALATSEIDFCIGNRAAGDRPFQGDIDEVRAYSRALSADEIYLHYLAGALKLGLI